MINQGSKEGLMGLYYYFSIVTVFLCGIQTYMFGFVFILARGHESSRLMKFHSNCFSMGFTDLYVWVCVHIGQRL